MCGHCGIIGPGINSWDLSIVRDLLTVSTLRGEDSTGVLQGKSETWFGASRTDYVIEKMASEALYFKWFHLRAKTGNRRILNSTSDNFMCCHVRAATKGSIVDENAHPFEFDKLIGMHNGTLREYKYEDRKTNKTDSELMFKDMNERGIIPVLQDLDEWSAYASVTFNKETGEISFFRNVQRSLYYAIHASRDVLYYASEQWMLKEMLARNTEKIYKDTIWNFKPNFVYTIHPQDVKAKESMPFSMVEYKPKVYKAVNTNKSSRFQAQEELLLAPPRSNEALIRQQMGMGPEFKIETSKKVIRHDFSKPTINSKTKIPTVLCCACSKKLSLVDVFYATKLNQSGTTVVCVDCNETFQTDFKSEAKQEVIVH